MAKKLDDIEENAKIEVKKNTEARLIRERNIKPIPEDLLQQKVLKGGFVSI